MYKMPIFDDFRSCDMLRYIVQFYIDITMYGHIFLSLECPTSMIIQFHNDYVSRKGNIYKKVDALSLLYRPAYGIVGGALLDDIQIQIKDYGKEN